VEIDLAPVDNPPMDDPVYTVRFSRRARRISLRVLPQGTVELVLPAGCSEDMATRFVARNREWIVRTRQRLQRASRVLPEQNGPRPARIKLAAVNENWKLEYDPVAVRLSTRGGTGCLSLPDGDDRRISFLLQRWIRSRAAAHFRPWLQELADEYGFPINKVSIRNQRSRWGSCSAGKNISLNANLLFLRPPVVRYLFVHELCHTVHLNHSSEYWKLVADLEPYWKQLDRELREAYRYVPSWALPPD
jgi:predicted metal-dependent hydrolase